MTDWAPISLVVCVVVSVVPGICVAETITFDDAGFTGDSGVFAGDLFGPTGALFEHESSPGGAVFVKDGSWGNVARSLPYAAAFGPSTGEPAWTRSLRVDFVVPGTSIVGEVTQVSAWVGDWSGESETIKLTAFTENGSMIDEDAYTTTDGGARDLGLVEVSGSGIAYVVFSTTHAVSMDDLQFDTPTPEPATLSLLVMGAMALVWPKRRRLRGDCQR